MALLDRLSPPTVNQLRLASGLILAVFAVSHFSNHTVGLISTQAADDARVVFMTFWHTPVGTTLLYGALVL
ncbi:MAG: adenylate/guanylate cyclase domain-containing protein, partial [Pseudomonadota bacterium]